MKGNNESINDKNSNIFWQKHKKKPMYTPICICTYTNKMRKKILEFLRKLSCDSSNKVFDFKLINLPSAVKELADFENETMLMI